MQKAIKVVAYNPTTEEELHFSCKAQCAKYFDLKANTVIRWLDNGMPVIELLTDLDRNKVEIEKCGSSFCTFSRHSSRRHFGM